jgi:hypothetical protein
LSPPLLVVSWYLPMITPDPSMSSGVVLLVMKLAPGYSILAEVPSGVTCPASFRCAEADVVPEGKL